MIFFLSFHPNPIDISYPKPTKSWIFMVFISVLSSVGDNLERKIIFKIPFRKTQFFWSWILVLQTHSATQNSVSNRGGGYLEQKKMLPLNFSLNSSGRSPLGEAIRRSAGSWDFPDFRKFVRLSWARSPSSRGVRSSDHMRCKALNVIFKKNQTFWKNLF